MVVFNTHEHVTHTEQPHSPENGMPRYRPASTQPDAALKTAHSARPSTAPQVRDWVGCRVCFALGACVRECVCVRACLLAPQQRTKRINLPTHPSTHL